VPGQLEDDGPTDPGRATRHNGARPAQLAVQAGCFWLGFLDHLREELLDRRVRDFWADRS
jgi:hypothetical protein